MQSLETQLLVLGGGPGGYVTAIRAGQLGIPTVLVEAQALGGTCLNVGCIPSKALIHVAERFHQLSEPNEFGISGGQPHLDLGQAIAWKDRTVDRLTSGVGALLKKHRVHVIHGHGQIVDGKTVQVGDTRIHCQQLVLATGSRAMSLPGLAIGGPIMDSTQALSPETLPRHLAVIGGGYIGLELGTAYRKLGAKVTIVEAQPRLLPTYDSELTAPVLARLQQLGIKVLTDNRVEGYDAAGQRLQLGSASGDTASLEVDRVLVAVGRTPHTGGYGLERLDLERAGKAVKVDGGVAPA